MNVKNIVKGVSFLLCLGFLACATNAMAKSSLDDYANQYNNEKATYGECKNAQKYINEGIACDTGTKQKALEAACKVYQSVKAEYKTCMSGGKPESKAAYDALTTANTCESTALKNIKEAFASCKAAVKANKKANKANDKADKAKEAAGAAQKALTKAENAYNKAVANCKADETSADCGRMNDLYKDYQKKAKAAGKTAKAATKANLAAAAQNKAYQSAADEACGVGMHNVGGKCEPIEVDLSNEDPDIAGVKADSDAAKAAATGSSSLTCSNVSKKGEANGTFAIFDYLACRITLVVADVRAIVYILAGFGMIAFAYGAIIGKINFKQLANIFIGLFILSMTTGLIEAIVFNDGTSQLTYHNYLKDGNHGQYSSVSADCSSDASLCPDVELNGMKADADNSSWSLSDLKNTIKSAKKAVKTASNTVKTVKNTVETTVNAVENIGNAIKNGGDITDVVSNIAANVSNVVGTANMAANQLANNYADLANDIRDAQSTEEQLKYREEVEKRYNLLKGKCDTGNCSENEKKSLEKMAEMVEADKTKADKWLENDGKGGGSTILSGLGKAANIASSTNKVTSNIAQAQNDGSALAGGALGDVLGVAFAAGEAYTSGSDAYDKAKSDGSLDFRSNQTKSADDARHAQQAAEDACIKKGGKLTGGKCMSDKGVEIDITTGARTKSETDGKGNKTTATSTTDAAGNKTTTAVVTDKDGKKVSETVTVENKDGTKTVTVKENGKNKSVSYDKDGKLTSVDGQKAADQKATCTQQGKVWDDKLGCRTHEAVCQSEGKTYDSNSKKCVAKKEGKKANTKKGTKSESKEEIAKKDAECKKQNPKSHYNPEDKNCQVEVKFEEL